MVKHPIQFAFPNRKLPKSLPPKTHFFSDLSPMGQAKKYRFFEENDYYDHYGKAHFAVTTKKGGWDCLRHYEILASGTLPYFLDIQNCPPQTLALWPKELLLEVKNLPGMPSEKTVIRATLKGQLDQLKPGPNFDPQSYHDLREKFLSVFKQNLCCNGLVRHIKKTLNLDLLSQHKVLVAYGVDSSILDYQRDLLVAGLGADPNVELTAYPWPFWHQKSCHRSILNTLYGRGFSCTATLEGSELGEDRPWDVIAKKINDFDLIIACSSSNKGFSALPQEVQKTLGTRNDVVWVDGNDIIANHAAPSCARIVFQREL